MATHIVYERLCELKKLSSDNCRCKDKPHFGHISYVSEDTYFLTLNMLTTNDFEYMYKALVQKLKFKHTCSRQEDSVIYDTFTFKYADKLYYVTCTYCTCCNTENEQVLVPIVLAKTIFDIFYWAVNLAVYEKDYDDESIRILF